MHDERQFASEVMDRPERARRSNARVARAAIRLRFVSRVPFLCECGEPDCTELVLLRLDQYEQARSAPILAPGHRAG